MNKESKIRFIRSTMLQMSGRVYMRDLSVEELRKLSQEAIEALRLFVLDIQRELSNAKRKDRRWIR